MKFYGNDHFSKFCQKTRMFDLPKCYIRVLKSLRPYLKCTCICSVLKTWRCLITVRFGFGDQLTALGYLFAVLSDKGKRSMYDAGVLDLLDDDDVRIKSILVILNLCYSNKNKGNVIFIGYFYHLFLFV